MNWLETLGKIAPTVASMLGGPLAGAGVAILGELFGISEPTQDKIKGAIESGSLTGEQISAIKQLEMKLKSEEQERGFRYAELEFKDRDSARKANVEGGTTKMLFSMSIVLLIMCLGAELYVLFNGYPKELSEIIVGRVLGLMDSVTILVLSYWYGSTNGSARKTDLLNAKA